MRKKKALAKRALKSLKRLEDDWITEFSSLMVEGHVDDAGYLYQVLKAMSPTTEILTRIQEGK